MPLFFTFAKSGINLIRTVLEEYCEQKSIPFHNTFESSIIDCKSWHVMQVEGNEHYFFMQAITKSENKSVGVFRDPRDQLISAYYYYKKLNPWEDLSGYSKMYPSITLQQCVEQGIDDWNFWYEEFKYKNWNEIYSTLLSVDKDFLCVRLENLCHPEHYRNEWKKISEWTNLPGLDEIAIQHSICNPEFKPSSHKLWESHVRSNGRKQDWDKIIDSEVLLRMEREMALYIDLLNKLCPLYD